MSYYDIAPLCGLGLSETRLDRSFVQSLVRICYFGNFGRILEVWNPNERDGIGKWFDVQDINERFNYSYDAVIRFTEFLLERLGLRRLEIIYTHAMNIFTHGSKYASDREINEFFKIKEMILLFLRDYGVAFVIGMGSMSESSGRVLLSNVILISFFWLLVLSN